MDNKDDLVKNAAEGLKALAKTLEASPEAAKSLNEIYETLEKAKKTLKGKVVKETESQHDIKDNKEVPPSMADKAEEMKKEQFSPEHQPHPGTPDKPWNKKDYDEPVTKESEAKRKERNDKVIADLKAKESKKLGKAGEGMTTMAGSGGDTACPTMGAGSALAMAEEPTGEPKELKDEGPKDWKKLAKKWKKKAKKWKALAGKGDKKEDKPEVPKSPFEVAKSEFMQANLAKCEKSAYAMAKDEFMGKAKMEEGYPDAAKRSIRAARHAIDTSSGPLLADKRGKFAVRDAKEKLAELKDQPKPNLPKSQYSMAKDEFMAQKCAMTKSESAYSLAKSEFLAKGDVVDIKSKKVISSDKDADTQDRRKLTAPPIRGELRSSYKKDPARREGDEEELAHLKRKVALESRPPMSESPKAKKSKAPKAPVQPKVAMQKDETQEQKLEREAQARKHRLEQEARKKAMKKAACDEHDKAPEQDEMDDCSSEAVKGEKDKSVKDELGNGQSDKVRNGIIRDNGEKLALKSEVVAKDEPKAEAPKASILPSEPKKGSTEHPNIPPKGSKIALKGPIKPESIDQLKARGYHPYFKARMDMAKGDVVDIKSKKVISTDKDADTQDRRRLKNGLRAGDRPSTKTGASGGMGGRREDDDPRYKKPFPQKRNPAFGERSELAHKLHEGHTKRAYEQKQVKSKAAREALKEFYPQKDDEKAS